MGNFFIIFWYAIIPCSGRTSLDKDIKYANIGPSDHILILIDQKPFKCFKSETKDLDKIIIPFNNDYSSFFMGIENYGKIKNKKK